MHGFELIDRIVSNRAGAARDRADRRRATSRPRSRAMRAGAYDFVTKPVDLAALALAIKRAAERRALRAEVAKLRRVVAEARGSSSSSVRARRCSSVYDVIAQVGPTDATVLITGQSGTGKEMVARSLHQHSRRRDAAVHRGRLRGDSRAADRERAVRSRARRVHRCEAGARRACSRRPTAERCSSTRSPSSRSPSSRSCCACCRSAACGRSAATPRSAFDVRLVARDQSRSRGDGPSSASSARISTTGSTSSTCRCRRCACAPATCCCSPSTSSITSRGCSRATSRGLSPEAADAAARATLARQRPRATQRDRARGRDVRGQRDRGRGSAGADPRLSRRARCRRARPIARSSVSLEELERRHILRVLEAKEGNKLAASHRCSASIARRCIASSCATAWSASHDHRGAQVDSAVARRSTPWPALGCARDRRRRCRSACSASTSCVDRHTAGSHGRARRGLAALGRARRRPALSGVPALDREPRRPIRSHRSPSRSTPMRARTIRSRPARAKATSGTGSQGLLAHLRHEQPLPTAGASATLVSEIETSIARLVADQPGRARARHARRSSRRITAALVLDAIVGVITLVLVVARRARARRARCAASARLLRVHLATARRAHARARRVRVAHGARSQGPAQPDPRLRRSC